MNTCRMCGEQEPSGSGKRLFKYGTRHYAHAQCGFARFGVGFLDRLPQHQLGLLPYRVIADAGLLDEVERRIKAAEAA